MEFTGNCKSPSYKTYIISSPSMESHSAITTNTMVKIANIVSSLNLTSRKSLLDGFEYESDRYPHLDGLCIKPIPITYIKDINKDRKKCSDFQPNYNTKKKLYYFTEGRLLLRIFTNFKPQSLVCINHNVTYNELVLITTLY